jgi:hypothetical protein
MPRYKIHVSHDRAVLDEDNQLVVMARTPEEASLFAAAPELLLALTALLRSLTWPGPIPWAQAEAAIRKATEEVGA